MCVCMYFQSFDFSGVKLFSMILCVLLISLVLIFPSSTFYTTGFVDILVKFDSMMEYIIFYIYDH